MKKSHFELGELSDFEIWNLFRSGDHSALEFIYNQYFDQLYNYGCQFMTNHAVVEDAIQELFIDLNRRSGNLSETDRILPYLYSAFRRKIIRLKDKENKYSSSEDSRSFPISAAVDESIIEDEQKLEYLKKLKRGIGTLSEKHREIIYLFYFENLTYEEIKEIQGYDHVKSVRNLLYKAIKSLRGAMAVLFIFIAIEFFRI